MYSPNTIKKCNNCLPDLKFFGLALYRQRWWNYFFEYLRKIETKFEDSLRCESGAHMGSINEKNQRPKISCFCPFNTQRRLSENFFIWLFSMMI
jgi:hypothetical protein